ncbi:fumarylacetoacetate hydrolase family protein [Mycobacterium sp. Y57]|uniref:fumarylacetoacetate hydrolase family protein n=1 Tax=Mycolicibacterium xanthum TaxID=2796469 RepID=UPI001C84955D|nr:fumarylacetoacetate hydrolase family protein [Mycolicibacterium xanthum]MBX7430507.1 fumarylacetoacetate hydrolase family protein [Mycolicibacterium xanthum]
MRLATYVDDTTPARGPRVGVVLDDQIVDVTDIAPTMQALVAGGAAMLSRVRAAYGTAPRKHLSRTRLLAPFPRPAKNMLCLGMNYRSHVAEGARTGVISGELPTAPVWFTKAVTSVCGPYDDIAIDTTLSSQYDWEAELMAVVGKAGRNIAAEEAHEYVHSYTVFNDVTARDLQLRGGGMPQWFIGKSIDKSSPMGPWLVTADEFDTRPNFEVSCRVNGKTRQKSNTEQFIFDIPTAIADISRILTLEPGDLIATGTPEGTGFAHQPSEFLEPGDVMETEVEGIGTLRNRIVEERSAVRP